MASGLIARLVTIAVAATALTVPATLVAAPAASAALYECNTVITFSGGNETTQRPGYTRGGGSSSQCFLAIGSTGEEVRVLQASLKFCNIPDPGPADGVYGTRTANAVRWIQAVSGLQQDGVYGPDTERVMGWVYFNHATGRGRCA